MLIHWLTAFWHKISYSPPDEPKEIVHVGNRFSRLGHLLYYIRNDRIFTVHTFFSIKSLNEYIGVGETFIKSLFVWCLHVLRVGK